jgi:hypothetical protein
MSILVPELDSVVIMDLRCRLEWDGVIHIQVGDGIMVGVTLTQAGDGIMAGVIHTMDGTIHGIIHAVIVMGTMIGIMVDIHHTIHPILTMVPENPCTEPMVGKICQIPGARQIYQEVLQLPTAGMQLPQLTQEATLLLHHELCNPPNGMSQPIRRNTNTPGQQATDRLTIREITVHLRFNHAIINHHQNIHGQKM